MPITRQTTLAQHAAFTLIEAMVVIILLAVFAGMIVPRMLNTPARSALNEARAVERLLSVAAEKATMLAEPVAIEYLAASKTLTVSTQRARTGSDGVRLAPEWRQDSLVEPVTLTYTELADARADAVPLNRTQWRVTFVPGQPRPDLVISLTMPSGPTSGHNALIALPPHASKAARLDTSPASPASAGSASAIDLDDTGKGNKTW